MRDDLVFVTSLAPSKADDAEAAAAAPAAAALPFVPGAADIGIARYW